MPDEDNDSGVAVGVAPALSADQRALVTQTLDPAVRMIHHQACTGGTLICKCLAAMPNTVVLSEIEPYSRLHIRAEELVFAPTDLIQQAIQAGIPVSDDSISSAFTHTISRLSRDAHLAGQRLLIREHSHSNYFVGAEVAPTPTMRSLISKTHRLLSIVSVRDPVDSFLSLENRKWLHFSPDTFTEYCRRYLVFLEDHAQFMIYRYEDFVAQPQAVLRHMCLSLELAYSPSFVSSFGAVALTGDSGRMSAIISPRPRRDVSETKLEAMLADDAYKAVMAQIAASAQAFEPVAEDDN